MLKNHGIVTAGPTIDEVVIRTIMFENAAQIQMIMEAAGDTAPEFPTKDIEQLKYDISPPEQFHDQLRLPGAPSQAAGKGGGLVSRFRDTGAGVSLCPSSVTGG